MYLVGCAYNLCWEHDSLRVAAEPNARLVAKLSYFGSHSNEPGSRNQAD